MKLSHSVFSPDNQAFITYTPSSPAAFEPSFYHQAINNPLWIDAMNKEFLALESNNTWTLVSLPPGKKTIGCKWVYKVKTLANGQIDIYKQD